MSFSQNRCLSLLSRCRVLVSLRQVHAYVLKTGLDSDPLVAGKLLYNCVVNIPDGLSYAHCLFLSIPTPDVFMYNTLIRGLSESDSPHDALVMFKAMLRKSMAPPDSFSFAFAVKAAANCADLKLGLQLHRQVLGHGMDSHLFVGTTLISMYGECGEAACARKVFEEMSEPNVVAWNAILTACFRCEDLVCVETMFDRMPIRNLTSWNLMLAGYTKAGNLERAKEVFSGMLIKDDVSWSTMIVGFAQNGEFDDAFGFFRELLREGMRPNEASLTGTLSACAQEGALELGKVLHGFLEKSGFQRITSVSNALIDTYSKCGSVESAWLVFERMAGDKSIVSWTTMIAGLAMHGYGEEAIRLFDEMVASGMRPDGIIFIHVLYACSHGGLTEQAFKFFSQMTEIYGIEPTMEHYGCMVDLYGRAGKLQQAFEFVCRMPILPNPIIWRTLLWACCIHGNLKLAEQVREILSELDPGNSDDHVLLSNIYAVSGKWKEVLALRRSMVQQNIKKTPGWSVIEVDNIRHLYS